MNNNKKCLVCGYGWVSRIPNPKSCPECKSRLGKQKKNS